MHFYLHCCIDVGLSYTCLNVLCVCVCVLVLVIPLSPAKMDKTDRDVVWGADIYVDHQKTVIKVHTGASWRIRSNDPYATAMLPCVKLL